MPRRREPTPPERRRPPRGSCEVRLPPLGVPRDTADALDALAAEWQCSVSEARRRCYREAAAREERRR